MKIYAYEQIVCKGKECQSSLYNIIGEQANIIINITKDKDTSFKNIIERNTNTENGFEFAILELELLGIEERR